MMAFIEERELLNPYFILLVVAAVVASPTFLHLFIIVGNQHLNLAKAVQTPHVKTAYGWGSFLAHGVSPSSIRDKHIRSIIQLSIWGASHNVVYTPTLIRSFANLRPSIVDFFSIKWKIFNRTFGVPSEYRDAYLRIGDELDTCIAKHLLQEPHMSNLFRAVVANTRNNVEKLVTTSLKTKVEMKPWERNASCKLIAGDLGSAFEISLFPLLTSFMGHMTLPTIMGKAFMANSPNAVEDLEILDDGFLGITMSLPRWLPIPFLRRAYEARDRLLHGLACLYSSFDRMADGQDPGLIWRDTSDVSHLVKNLDVIWKKGGLSVAGRAAGGLSLLWAFTLNANNTVFWMILRIYATPGLIERLRDETKALFVQASGSNETSSDDADLSVDNIGRLCPTLKACYFETLRLDSEIRSIRKVKKETFIPVGESRAMHKLNSGDYIHALHHLHHTDPRFFPDPQAFRPERFLIRDECGLKASQGTLRPYGAGFSMCKGRVIAERTILFTVAAILQGWDIEPTDVATGWKIPDHIGTAGVSKPKEDIRVVLKRRSSYCGRP